MNETTEIANEIHSEIEKRKSKYRIYFLFLEWN